MAFTVEKLPIPPLKLGEGPHWDVPSQSLYLVDISGGAVVRYDLAAHKSFIAKLDLPSVNFIIPVEGSKGRFVISSYLNLYLIDWDGRSDKISSMELLHELTGEKENMINDGKCDSTGRLWFGTMPRWKDGVMGKTTGSLYSFTKEEGCRQHASDIKLSNGLGWNPQGTVMYYVDTMAAVVYSYDCNKNGSIENQKVLYKVQGNDMSCLPDGMTVDKDGKPWVAIFGKSQVVNLDPRSGEVLREVPIPTPQVTSVAWGGPDLSDLYVTTGDYFPDGGSPPEAGCTFRVKGLLSSGTAMNDFKL